MNEDKLKAQLNYIESGLAKTDRKYLRVLSNLSSATPVITSEIEWNRERPNIVNEINDFANKLRSQSEKYKPQPIVGTEAEIRSLRQLADPDFKPNLPDHD